MTCLRSFARDLSFPAYEPGVLYFEVSLGVTAYVGRTNLALPLVSCAYSSQSTQVHTCRCCRPLSPHQGVPSHAPPGPSVSSPSRGPPRPAARGSGGCATTSSRARARWISGQHIALFLSKPNSRVFSPMLARFLAELPSRCSSLDLPCFFHCSFLLPSSPRVGASLTSVP
jgi:hypothetical protein